MSNTPLLQGPVADYINGINNGNLDLVLGSFLPEAEIIDDGKEYTGEAIKSFIRDGILGHNGQMRALSSTSHNSDTTNVHVLMDGGFASYGIHEPFDLFLTFTLVSNKIRHLVQGDVDGTKPTMRTVYAASGNLDDPLSSLRIGRRNLPDPPQGFVRVKMEAVGLNFHDVFTLRGISMHQIRFPMILGNEGAGVLDDGTKVALYPNMGDVDYKGDETLDPARHVLGEKVQGTLAEYVYVPRRNAVPRPQGLNARSASVLGIAWLTAFRMLFSRANLRPGNTILVQGSSGGIATALIQLGTAAGYRVWTTGRTAEKRALATKLGAERTFSSLETLPEQMDAVFDLSGSATLAHSIRSVKTGGTVVICGVHSDNGTTVVPIDLLPVMVNSLNITGVYTGTREEFVDLLSFVAAKEIKPYIGQVLPLERAGDGLRDIWEGRTSGKIVIEL
ncbi:hypothetical protein B0A52_02775 [Exophiala mesophila]|uniref:Enoyl reductase (ER) domain-containing protein n=1 Tax=Exophiala mesophila TaxID=212818 RepID=A0A438NE00_EXOME|nr:hypothetical protein B0A52_02775 [Exophiala mesophila]